MKHLLIPVLGVLAMIPAMMSVIGGLTIPFFDVELPAYENALRYTAPIVGVWMAIGIILYFWLRMRSPQALQRMGDIYGGESSSD